MKKVLFFLLIFMLMTVPALAYKYAVIETNYGDITLELDDEKAPISVENFLVYAALGHYDGTIFHRVIKDFMIQGGNFSTEMVPKKPRAPVKNEATNGLKNLRGSIAMARTNVVDSATSQFFINLKDNGFLDHRDKSPRGYGYAVFGKVIEGMDVVDKIGVSPTHTFKRFRDVPVEPVIIHTIEKIQPE
jgi:cyclophilin family peptidyl-prolyl cis-trans isomerase